MVLTVTPIFDVYTPTRTSNCIEVRIRSSLEGPVSLVCNGKTTNLNKPVISYQDRHFYRYVVNNLPSADPVKIEVTNVLSGLTATAETSTLEKPSGSKKLSVGILADLHLPAERATIEQYRPGVRRMSGLGQELALRYIKRLEDLGADMIVLPGDLVDPCNYETLHQLKNIMRSVSVPCYPLIGNHEPWSPEGEKLFYEELGLPATGYYVVRTRGMLLIMLSTPSPDSLNSSSLQFKWLTKVLANSDQQEDIVLFAHFSLVLHPCVQGNKNDGYQLLDNHQQILDLFCAYPNVRLYIAGHKNVPSMIQHGGVIHTLSPQLIQFPCGYDMFTFYDRGVTRTTYEIGEQHYCEIARAAYTTNWLERFGSDPGRNFYQVYES